MTMDTATTLRRYSETVRRLLWRSAHTAAAPAPPLGGPLDSSERLSIRVFLRDGRTIRASARGETWDLAAAKCAKKIRARLRAQSGPRQPRCAVVEHVRRLGRVVRPVRASLGQAAEAAGVDATTMGVMVYSKDSVHFT